MESANLNTTDQVASAQLRQDHESDATATLENTADTFRASGIDLTDILVFTHDREQSIDRVAKEYRCDAILTLCEVERIETALVPVRDDTNLERIVSLLASVMRVNDASITFFHSVAEDSDSSHGEFLVRGAVDRLDEVGTDRERIDWRLSDEDRPATRLLNSQRINSDQYSFRFESLLSRTRLYLVSSLNPLSLHVTVERGWSFPCLR